MQKNWIFNDKVLKWWSNSWNKIFSSFFFLFTFTFIFILQSCAPLTRRAPISRPQGSPSALKNFNPIKKKIVLLPFFNEAPMGGEDIAIVATQEVQLELAKSREYIIDNEFRDIFGSSREVYSGGGLKLSQLSRKAKLSGVNLVIFGRLTQARVRQKSDEIGLVRKVKTLAETMLEIKVYDVHTNKEILSNVFDGNINDANYRFYQSKPEDNMAYRQEILRYSARVAARKTIPSLIKVGEKLDWIGRVARILESRIYINAGRTSGIHVGDILKVVTEGEEIYDPESGAVIGMSEGITKGTLEVIDYFGQDGAICILHSGGAVTEGDFVMLY